MTFEKSMTPACLRSAMKPWPWSDREVLDESAASDLAGGQAAPLRFGIGAGNGLHADAQLVRELALGRQLLAGKQLLRLDRLLQRIDDRLVARPGRIF